ncbi:E3 SUMO-protein ligase KIAA1586-like [Saccoglossus kowalevskii]|uniref:Uncharacterized protein KIAA1586-like n=1 Tax=Saccoglossus kowalevskii TaxID=10224 RepID=A0ABM0MTY7_SACKO|nr:PREDICTED: uncharacterized protein KIAA1586-like [Saccoglossus kowalevskii]
MSIVRYFTKPSAPESPSSANNKRRLDQTVDKVDKRSKNQRYDDSKCQRKFLPKWIDQWPWLQHRQDKIFCQVCLKYPSIAKPSGKRNAFFDGCDIFRVESIRSHESSRPHLECFAYFCRDDVTQVIGSPNELSSPNINATPIGLAMRKLNDDQLRRYSNLFSTVFMLAKYGKPMSDMPMQCALLRKVGAEIGDNYQNDKSASAFLTHIAAVIKKNNIHEIQDAAFLSVLADGSADVSIIEQENIFVRYVSKGVPVTTMVSIEAPAHSHALGVYEAIKDGLNSVNLNMENMTSRDKPGPKLVCANFDGASVMQGRKSGVVAHILEEAPYVIPVHCILLTS